MQELGVLLMQFVYNLKFNGSFKLYRCRIKIHQMEEQWEINRMHFGKDRWKGRNSQLQKEKMENQWMKWNLFGEKVQICKLKGLQCQTPALLLPTSFWHLEAGGLYAKMWSNPHLPSSFGMVSAVILPFIQNMIIKERWKHWNTNQRVTRIIRAQGKMACQGQVKEMQHFRLEKTERKQQSQDA